MNNSLKSVCEKHNINFSSAKNVIQIYKKEGRLEKKVHRIRKTKRNNKHESKFDPLEVAAQSDEDSEGLSVGASVGPEERKSDGNAGQTDKGNGTQTCGILL